MKNFSQLLGSLLLLMVFQPFVQGQSTEKLIQNYLTENKDAYRLTDRDIQDWVIYDRHTSKKSQVEHVYIRQQHAGIDVYNAVANFGIKDHTIISSGIRLTSAIADRVNTTQPVLTAKEAVQSAAEHLEIKGAHRLNLISSDGKNTFTFEGGNVSIEAIPVQLMFLPIANENREIRLVWDLSIYEYSEKHWWSMRIDAITGEVLDTLDWVVECNFGDHTHFDYSTTTRKPIPAQEAIIAAPAPPPGTDQYRVFAIPTESPNHGPRTLVVGPYDPTASPYGWHDDNGVPGHEYTITRGNNVQATEDRNNNNGTGYFPNGGPSLSFDYPLNLNLAPINYEDAAITNLFYMNNIMHDVWYHYGFTEASGNFQENNYGNGGAASDMVFAEAQDGGGMNNANFATPADGGNPRMQMYLWNAGNPYFLTINSPSGIAGQYQAVEAGFGPAVPTIPLTADLALVNDNVGPDVNDACEPIVNATSINGKIAVILRGTCGFVDKVQAAQNAGAVAVIMVNNVAGAPIAMGGTSTTITIPSVMVSDIDGAAIIAQLQAATTVNGTLQNPGPAAENDGDLDNGIIAHEYGHGISNRLTGGPSAANCLGNAEQMGEGWSDWFALMLTIEPGDLGTDVRGIGTYAINEPVTGPGIRPAPYSTDFQINNYTYAATNNTGAISQPHGIGFVWSTMLWDLTWALINQYGYDSDLYNGTGGNNIAMHLVTEGLKLQPCSPGFVDGRDAILAADQALYGGANKCLIWNVFANRGLGFSASQGSSSSRTDQVEAFDLPTSCQAPTMPPSADFSFVLTSNCGGEVQFTDESTLIPQTWDWDFGDGNGSTLQYPTHTYTSSGTYTVTLIAANTFGSDTSVYNVTVSLPDAPVVANQTICANNTVTFTGAATGDIIWYDASGTTALDTASTYTTPVLTTSTSYMVENVLFAPIQNVGPLSPAIGNSAYHNQATVFTLNFTAQDGFTLLSVWIDANSTGSRTINIWDGANGAGTIVASQTISITTTGWQKVTLNMDVPSAGNYSIGGTNMNMRRNNGGVSYPYTLAGLVDITSSSAGANFYYYYYDWEVQALPCRSALVPVDAIVNEIDSTFEVVSTCGSYTWPTNGTTYTSSGNYSVSMTNSAGCDSIASLDLTILSPSAGSESITACNNYTWSANGVNYTSSGIYTALLTNAAGCDSTATLNLTINANAQGSASVSACDSYTWSANGTTYTNSGNYTALIAGTGGCDSLATLNLTITTNTSGSASVTACGSYTWSANGNTYTNSGVFTETLASVSGCDSIATLNLTIQNPNSGSSTITVCDSYTWSANGNTYTSSGSYTETLVNQAGCDSIATLNLTVLGTSSSQTVVTECNSYTWPANGTTYQTSGNYSITLTNSAGCDSIVTLNLTIQSVDVGITQTSDVSLEANTSGAQYQWIDCATGNAISGETNQSFTASSNGSYAVEVTQNGCVDTSACMAITTVGLKDLLENSTISVYPNPTHQKVKVDVGEVVERVDVTVFDVSGKEIQFHQFENTQEFDLEINEAPGIYFIELEIDGTAHTVKLFKE